MSIPKSLRQICRDASSVLVNSVIWKNRIIESGMRACLVNLFERPRQKALQKKSPSRHDLSNQLLFVKTTCLLSLETTFIANDRSSPPFSLSVFPYCNYIRFPYWHTLPPLSNDGSVMHLCAGPNWVPSPWPKSNKANANSWKG
jgi:hypothetical protein